MGGSVAPGLYRHYKGAEYRVLGCVRHSESEARLVLYRALYGERGLWVRPLEMFTGTVDTAEGPRPRFALVREGAGLADDTDDDSGRGHGRNGRHGRGEGDPP